MSPYHYGQYPICHNDAISHNTDMIDRYSQHRWHKVNFVKISREKVKKNKKLHYVEKSKMTFKGKKYHIIITGDK